MKKALVASILGVAATLGVVGSSHAQGFVVFNTYSTGNGYITFGNGAQSGAVPDTYHAEIYFALSDVTGSVSFASPDAAPTGGGLQLYTGQNNIAPFLNGFINGADLAIPGYTSGLVTFVIVAYSGADFASSFTNPNADYRGHSAAFTETLVTGNNADSAFANSSNFSVFTPVPEPSTFALAGLGIGSMLFLRRRK